NMCWLAGRGSRPEPKRSAHGARSRPVTDHRPPDPTSRPALTPRDKPSRKWSRPTLGASAPGVLLRAHRSLTPAIPLQGLGVYRRNFAAPCPQVSGEPSVALHPPSRRIAGDDGNDMTHI